MLSGTEWDCCGVCAGPGIGLDPQGSLPTQDILGFWDSMDFSSLPSLFHILKTNFSFTALLRLVAGPMKSNQHPF